MQKILLLLVVFSPFIGFTQQDTTKGKLRIYTNDKEAIIRLDTSKINFGEFYNLTVRTYSVRAWAPGRQLIEKDVIVRKGRYSTVRVKLPYTEAFKKYRWKNRRYEFKKNGLKYGPMSIYGVFAISRLFGIVLSNRNANRALERAEENKRIAENSFWVEDVEKNRREFVVNKNTHSREVEEVNQSWKEVQIGLGATLIVNYMTWKLAAKLKKPTFEETPLLSRVLIAPSIQSNSTTVHLALKF